MKFKYVGNEPFTEIFGLGFKKGETMEVEDEHAADKFSRMSLFQPMDEAAKTLTEKNKPKTSLKKHQYAINPADNRIVPSKKKKKVLDDGYEADDESKL